MAPASSEASNQAAQRSSEPRRRVAVLGGNRIPFARSDGAYAEASNQDMFTAALGGLVDRFGLAGERLGVVVGGAVLKHSRDFNLIRECVLGSELSSYTPAFDIQQACGTGLQAAIAAADGIAAGRYDVAAAGGVDTTSDPPIGLGDNLRRTLLKLRRSKSNVQRLKLVGTLPATLGLEIPANSEPRTGLSMGEHPAITAKQMGIKRVDQDELAVASHRNMAAAYDRGFFDDLVTPFLGLYRDDNLRPDSSAEKLATLRARVRREGRRRDDDGGQFDAADRRRLGRVAGHRGVGGRPFVDSAGLPGRRGDRRGRLRQRTRRPADGADVRGAPAAGPQRAEPAGLRLLRDPRGVRVGGAGAPAGVGVRGVLQGAAGSGRRAWDRSTGPSSMSTVRRWPPVTRSRPPAGGFSRRRPSSWPRRRRSSKGDEPVRGLISICAAGGQGVAAILEA